MTQDPFGSDPSVRFTKRLGTIPTYYELLDLPCSATADQVRRAYRSKSKLYHPDTTALPPEAAVQKFRELKEAYAVLNCPERRAAYDVRQQTELSSAQGRESGPRDERFRTSASAYLDPKERSLSPGEIFAVFLLGITFLICLVLAVILGIARGEMVIHTAAPTANVSNGAIVSFNQPSQTGDSVRLSTKTRSLKERQIKIPIAAQRPTLTTADLKTQT